MLWACPESLGPEGISQLPVCLRGTRLLGLQLLREQHAPADCLTLPSPTAVFTECFSAKKKKKVAEIYQALDSDPIDVAALRRMAISEGGLLTDDIRRKVWPRLLNVNTSEPPPPLGKWGPEGCGWAPRVWRGSWAGEWESKTLFHTMSS